MLIGYMRVSKADGTQTRPPICNATRCSLPVRGERSALESRCGLAQDDCRVRQPAARENLALLRHIALTRLKNDNTKLGIKNKH